MREALLTRGTEGIELIDLSLVRLASGEREMLVDDGELCAVVLSGAVEVEVNGAALGRGAREGTVFEAPGDAVYVPPGEHLQAVASSDAVLAVATAPVGDGVPGRSRIVGPADQRVRAAGTGNWARTIRTVLGPDADAARLILGETVNPPGNWSSYPPHKHDRDAPPDEVALEEVYLYRFEPAVGFGVQLVYDDTHERAQIVRDGDAVAIPAGYHPVVAAPGYALYYLWVMAGEGREMAPYLEPRHAWIQDGAV
ncbi:MAG TPA: 5-deoxy-glucuronate isomerase [Gaiella sp.]|nr:5-deoxy-glucuronate isomerase [Gaiella sp.]